ncbi:MAG: hypothetical protein EPN26_05815 [Rhodospirillales bacterium]|nr:MAG: hypothetical protein EPN26_05815 [Rhodospirillales bacterium]
MGRSKTKTDDAPAPATRRYRIDRGIISSAITASRLGEFEMRYADIECRGLSIRVRKGSASWTFNARMAGHPSPITRRIAEVRPDDDPEIIRQRAEHARDLVRRGIDPAAYFREQESGIHVDAPAADGWTWQMTVDNFLSDITERGTVAPRTISDYREKLRGKHFPDWNDRPFKSITAADVMRMQEAIEAAGKAGGGKGYTTLARNTLRVVKACMSWASRKTESGMFGIVSAAAATPQLEAAEALRKGRVPTMKELGEMPWKVDATADLAAKKHAAMLVLLTSQRRQTVMSMRREDIRFDDEEQVWLWDIPPLHTKRKRRPGEWGHVIPLTGPTLALVKMAVAQAEAAAATSPWVFPQSRLRRAADAGGGHMAPATPGRMMLNSGCGFTPHDIRRAFGHYAGRKGHFSRPEEKAILNHAEGLAGDLTAAHSELDEQLRLKMPVIRWWTDFILDLVRESRPPDRTDDLPGCLRGLKDA